MHLKVDEQVSISTTNLNLSFLRPLIQPVNNRLVVLGHPVNVGLGALYHLIRRPLGSPQLRLVLADEQLQLGQLQGGVEVVGHGGDDPAHAGADGGVVVAAQPVPVVTDPVPGNVATNQIPLEIKIK